MKVLTPIRLRFEKEVIAKVYRKLEGSGKITVRVGQEVSPSDVIGSYLTSAGFRILKLGKLLSVAPKDVKKYLKKSLNHNVYKGELIAFKDGWMFSPKKIILSPTDGVLDFLNEETGEIRLSFLPKKVDLLSGVYGVIEQVDNSRGFVEIKTEVARVYGMFGTGMVRDGILKFLGTKNSLITQNQITTLMDGQILVGGCFINKQAISSAISSGVQGIITGGINATDYKSISGGKINFPRKIDNDIGISVMVCEGFGSIPIGDDIYKVLSGFDGKFIFIDGNRSIVSLPTFASSSMIKIRSTKLPPTSGISYSSDYLELGELMVGSNVRIIGNFYTGEQGRLLSVDQTETMLASGIKRHLATVQTQYKKVQVPVNNLEIIR